VNQTWPELPDFLRTASDDDLRAAIRELQQQAHRISFRRRLLHGRIAVYEAELNRRAGADAS
jgi:hypothetical protein